MPVASNEGYDTMVEFRVMDDNIYGKAYLPNTNGNPGPIVWINSKHINYNKKGQFSGE